MFIGKHHAETTFDRGRAFLAVACVLTGVLGTAMGFLRAFASVDRLPQPFPILEVGCIALTNTIVGLTLSLVAVIARFAIQAKASRIRALQR